MLDHPRARVVDLRSPSEYAEDHLPGAVNVPLLDDAERAVVGLLYHEASAQRAFAHGLEVVRGKVTDLARRVAAVGGAEVDDAAVLAGTEELATGGLAGMEARLEPDPRATPPEEPIVLHCWRGGLRSRSVVALLRRLGLTRVVGLAGGYRAYRARVRAELEAWSAPPTFVLRGLTGVGKTLVLREVERLRPGWTVDLEAAAGHRSSLLGMVGLEPASQKAFDSRLAARLRTRPPGPVVLEGESRKVGDVIVPVRIWEAMGGAVNLLLEAGLQRRVDVLIEDYLARDDARPLLRRQLAAVEARMEGPRVDLTGLLDRGRERELVEILLERYYDPLYRRSERGKRYACTVDAENPRAAAARVVDLVEREVAPR